MSCSLVRWVSWSKYGTVGLENEGGRRELYLFYIARLSLSIVAYSVLSVPVPSVP